MSPAGLPGVGPLFGVTTLGPAQGLASADTSRKPV